MLKSFETLFFRPFEEEGLAGRALQPVHMAVHGRCAGLLYIRISGMRETNSGRYPFKIRELTLHLRAASRPVNRPTCRNAYPSQQAQITLRDAWLPEACEALPHTSGQPAPASGPPGTGRRRPWTRWPPSLRIVNEQIGPRSFSSRTALPDHLCSRLPHAVYVRQGRTI